MSDPDGWPIEIRGITESIAATEQPAGEWNQAPLGLHGAADQRSTDPVRARTWGNTRTRRNLARTSTGYIQFIRDPVIFTKAALGIRETTTPIEDAASAWVAVDATVIDRGEDEGTTWTEWRLDPVETTVEHQAVPRTDRGYSAVIEFTIAASRLGIATFDQEALDRRLEFFASVIERCGSPRDRDALELAMTLSGWSRDQDTHIESTTTTKRTK